ncbi:homocysteine S-methyltransferase family protein [Alginatibacterium sediminis]|uniref:Homocysteine S-methyltransferase family protein n=1 Tax=Alginatibacterium sediminis TaxID=2164068 RepID=A0A420EHB0_9ALTE|nr:homocysteine S-methyltransferase family protein [Alginatibacterium sediminis]RKF20095.1 homocysteine S-methyltransferase family protein [Alginatibacterium sediminis]
MNNNLCIIDGGMGRELQDIGAPFSQPLWSAQALIEAPEFVSMAHQNFVNAGAQIIIANSYACVPFHLGEARYQRDGAKLATLAAKIARQVSLTSTHVRVAGAIPPAFGSYRPDLFDAQQAAKICLTLINAQAPYVDLWIAETISSVAEYDVISTALGGNEKPSYYAFSLDDTSPTRPLLRSGESVELVCRRICSSQAQGILFNCSVPEVMLQAVKVAKQICQQQNRLIEVGVYANNFMPIDTDHEANQDLQLMRELSPQDYLNYAKRWYEAGATIIGGCCGIGPSHIQALAQWKSQLT